MELHSRLYQIRCFTASPPSWQQREHEVDEHVAAGRVVVHKANEDFLAHLDDLDAAE